MKTLKRPGIFLVQFASDESPFNNLEEICSWAAEKGYKGVQIPSNIKSLIDIEKAAESSMYCNEIKGTLKRQAW